jgi:hypothetical protein
MAAAATCATTVSFFKNGDIRANIQMFQLKPLPEQSQLCRVTGYRKQRPHFRLYDDGETEIFYKGAPVMILTKGADGITDEVTSIPRVLPRKLVMKFKRSKDTKEVLEIDWAYASTGFDKVNISGWLEVGNKKPTVSWLTSGGFPVISGGYTKISALPDLNTGISASDLLWGARIIRFNCGARFSFLPIIVPSTKNMNANQLALVQNWKIDQGYKESTELKNNFFTFNFHLPAGHKCPLPTKAKGFCARKSTYYLKSQCKRWSIVKKDGKHRLVHGPRQNCFESANNKCVPMTPDYVYKSTAMGNK